MFDFFRRHRPALNVPEDNPRVTRISHQSRRGNIFALFLLSELRQFYRPLSQWQMWSPIWRRDSSQQYYLFVTRGRMLIQLYTNQT
jgi:hypothetical protein